MQLAHFMEHQVLRGRSTLALQPRGPLKQSLQSIRLWAKGWLRKRLQMSSWHIVGEAYRYYTASRRAFHEQQYVGRTVDCSRISKREVMYGVMTLPTGLAGWALPKVYVFGFAADLTFYLCSKKPNLLTCLPPDLA